MSYVHSEETAINSDEPADVTALHHISKNKYKNVRRLGITTLPLGQLAFFNRNEDGLT